MRRLLYLLALCVLTYQFAAAQQYYSVQIKPSTRLNVPKVHSGAMAIYHGYWVFVGGRANGLHGFTTSAFNAAYANDSIWVYDPQSDQNWSTSMWTLGDSMHDPLASSNMQFIQQDSNLYLFGGYGYDRNIREFRTFETIHALSLPGIINATKNGLPIAPYIRQYKDSFIRDCGAEVIKVDTLFYQFFGHTFDGSYDRIATSPLFSQVYLCDIRRFTLHDDGSNLTLENKFIMHDSVNFHRRDFNLVPQIFPDRSYGATAFSGVFKPDVDDAYQNSIDLRHHHPYRIDSIQQVYNLYHSATLPIYDSLSNCMSTLFFGGHGLYYYDTTMGMAVRDSQIPFVNTITKVNRYADGSMAEIRLDSTLPGLLGTNAVFVPLDSVAFFHGAILDLNRLQHKTCVGFMVGGIWSPFANINAGNVFLSTVNPVTYEVWIDKDSLHSNAISSVESKLSFELYPDPATDYFTLVTHGPMLQGLNIKLYDAKGTLVLRKELETFNRIELSAYSQGQYLVTVSNSQACIWSKKLMLLK
jgi:hypothetical protein